MKKSCEFWCLSTEKYFVRTQKNTDPGPRQSQEAIFYWGYFPLFILNEYIKVRFLFFILFQKVHYLVFSICGVSLVRGSLSRFNFGTNLLKKKKNHRIMIGINKTFTHTNQWQKGKYHQRLLASTQGQIKWVDQDSNLFTLNKMVYRQIKKKIICYRD